MTFGSTFGRVLSPTFQPHSQKAADTNWWLSGGIAASNCLFAYQAVSMPTKASTLVNLANPGTYDLTEVGDVTWNSSDGWVGTGYNVGNYFYIPSIAMPAGNSSSVVAKVDPVFETNSGSFGNGSSYVLYHVTTGFWVYWRGVETKHNSTAYRGVEAVFAVAGGTTYRNKTLLASNTPSDLTGTYKIYIGTNQSYGTPVDNMKAIALYNTVLTEAQIGAVTDAINAL